MKAFVSLKFQATVDRYIIDLPDNINPTYLQIGAQLGFVRGKSVSSIGQLYWTLMNDYRGIDAGKVENTNGWLNIQRMTPAQELVFDKTDLFVVRDQSIFEDFFNLVKKEVEKYGDVSEKQMAELGEYNYQLRGLVSLFARKIKAGEAFNMDWLTVKKYNMPAVQQHYDAVS